MMIRSKGSKQFHTTKTYLFKGIQRSLIPNHVKTQYLVSNKNYQGCKESGNKSHNEEKNQSAEIVQKCQITRLELKDDKPVINILKKKKGT